MKKISKSLKDLRTTIPGILIIAASLVGFFLKLCSTAEMIAGITAGVTLMGINTQTAKSE